MRAVLRGGDVWRAEWKWGSRRLGNAAPAAHRKKKAEEQDEFRVLNFLRSREPPKRPPMKKEAVAPPRSASMPTDQHWPSVWPGPRSFHPGSVPLPLRQGYPMPRQASPGPDANAELMKIPNFLHLTPPAVRAQCEALKKFCTPWPAGLETDEKCDEKFPLQILTSDYCHSGPSIRDNLSRIVSVRIKLSDLTLDKHAKDKLLRLVEDKYNPETDFLTIVSDRCPVRKQNMDFCLYLLTAVFHESWTIEPWEAEKIEADMEEYIWENNESRNSVVRWYARQSGQNLSDEDIQKFDTEKIPDISSYKEAISELMNNGENDYQVKKYRMAVTKLFRLPVADQLEINSVNKS